MKRGHAHEVDWSKLGINICFNPISPCLQNSPISYRPLDFIILNGVCIKRSSSFQTNIKRWKMYQPQWISFPALLFCRYSSWQNQKPFLHLQDFHVSSVHPPYICVENQVIYTLPIISTVLDWFRHDYTVFYAVPPWIVWVRFNQKRCPIELHRGVVLLC